MVTRGPAKGRRDLLLAASVGLLAAIGLVAAVVVLTGSGSDDSSDPAQGTPVVQSRSDGSPTEAPASPSSNNAARATPAVQPRSDGSTASSAGSRVAADGGSAGQGAAQGSKTEQTAAAASPSPSATSGPAGGSNPDGGQADGQGTFLDTTSSPEAGQAADASRFDIVTVLPKDAIPSIDYPYFVTADQAGNMMADKELVIGVSIDGDHRAYSVPHLSGHEIVNDVVGGRPIAVTW